VKARRLLHKDKKYGDKYRAIVTGGCGGHALDLFIEDVVKMGLFSDLIKSIKRLVNVIYNHGKVHNEYFNVEKGGRLSRWVDTCFAIAKIMAEDVKANRQAIKRTVASDAFAKWAASGHSHAKTDEDGDKTNRQLAKVVADEVSSDAFWESLISSSHCSQRYTRCFGCVTAMFHPWVRSTSECQLSERTSRTTTPDSQRKMQRTSSIDSMHVGS
jgi:hypothetical protein